MRTLTVFILLLCAIAVNGLHAQALTWHQGIIVGPIDVRTAPVAVGQLTVTVPSAGTVIVRFDGACSSSPGDRIVLAASDQPDWGVNDGNVSLECLTNNLNTNPFSHTRSYNVNAGDHTYYGVVQNVLETDGDGKVWVYASLTVEFFPAAAPNKPFSSFLGIAQSNVALDGSVVTLGQVSINAPVAGTALVRFDGNCIASPGDRIVLAASDQPGWSANDGQVSVEVADSDVNEHCFSHTRTYEIGAGNHTFYAVGQNVLETDGSGMASVYGSLTVIFYPNSGASQASVQHEGIQLSSTNVEGAPYIVKQTTFNAPSAGTVIVNFDGYCIATPGDRIVVAAGNTANWSSNDGNVGIEVPDSDVNRSAFSHTRKYNVNAGANTFYAVAQNFVENDGDGIASIYGSLTVQFFANATSGTETPSTADLAAQVQVYPVPTTDAVLLDCSQWPDKTLRIRLMDSQGQVLQTLVREAPGNDTIRIDLSACPAGTYFLRLESATGSAMKEVSKI